MKTRTSPKFLVKQTKASRELNLAFQGPISRLFNLKRVKIEKWFSNFNPSHEVSIPRYFTTTDSHCYLWLNDQKNRYYKYIRYNFSSKQIVHQSTFCLCFWVQDLLINRFWFYYNLLIKRSGTQKQRQNELWWMILYDEKLRLKFIVSLVQFSLTRAGQY